MKIVGAITAGLAATLVLVQFIRLLHDTGFFSAAVN